MNALIWVLLLSPLVVLYRVSIIPEPRAVQRIGNALFTGFMVMDVMIVLVPSMAPYTSTEMVGIAGVAIVQLFIAGILQMVSSDHQKKKRNGSRSGTDV